MDDKSKAETDEEVEVPSEVFFRIFGAGRRRGKEDAHKKIPIIVGNIQQVMSLGGINRLLQDLDVELTAARNRIDELQEELAIARALQRPRVRIKAGSSRELNARKAA